MTKCVGLFGPCNRDADPLYQLDDPDGVEKPIPRCKDCAEASDRFIADVIASGRGPEFEAALLKAEEMSKAEETRRN